MQMKWSPLIPGKAGHVLQSNVLGCCCEGSGQRHPGSVSAEGRGSKTMNLFVLDQVYIWKADHLDIPGWECISLDIQGYPRIYILILGYPRISQDIPGYMETVTRKIFMLDGNFLMFEYACIHLPHILHGILWSNMKKKMGRPFTLSTRYVPVYTSKFWDVLVHITPNFE